MTRAEISHALFGTGLVVMSVSALWAWRRPDSPARFIWPFVLILVSFNLFVPAESPVDLDVAVGWRETIADLYPVDLGAWLSSLEHLFIVQHKLVGILGLLAGGVELARPAGRLGGAAWRWLLPAASVAAGLLLGVHGLGAEHIAHPEERVHHTIFAVCFVVGGVLLGLYRTGKAETEWFRDAWPLLVFVAGIDFAFFFRIG